MRKLIVLFCILSIAFASTANATETRVMTLGDVGAVIKDDAGVQTYPQTLRAYPNFGVAEITGASFWQSGWHMTHGDFTMGGYWTTKGWADMYLPDFNGNAVAGDDAIDQKFSLFYARELAGMPFGFTFELFGNNEENKGASKSLKTALGMKFGVGFTFVEALETSLKFGMLSWEEKDNAGDAVAEGEGGTTIVLNARYWMPEGEWGQMVPHFMFHMVSGGVKPAAAGSKPTTDDITAIDIGIGGTMPAGENIIMVHDLGIHMHSNTVDDGTTKTEMGMNLFPYFKGGMEAPLSEHFTFRCGGKKEWNSNSTKVGSNENLTSGATTTLYIGAGYNRGNFNVDLNLDPGFFTRGPYLISGAPGALATQASVTYAW